VCRCSRAPRHRIVRALPPLKQKKLRPSSKLVLQLVVSLTQKASEGFRRLSCLGSQPQSQPFPRRAYISNNSLSAPDTVKGARSDVICVRLCCCMKHNASIVGRTRLTAADTNAVQVCRQTRRSNQRPTCAPLVIVTVLLLSLSAVSARQYPLQTASAFHQRLEPRQSFDNHANLTAIATHSRGLKQTSCPESGKHFCDNLQASCSCPAV